MQWLLESERLGFRKICENDFESLCEILQDMDVMYAWEHPFTSDEVRQWIDKNLTRYARDGFSYFAAIEKCSGNFVGVIGPLMEEANGAFYVGIAYILSRKFWRKGFAVEGARAWMIYAFDTLGVQEVIAQIRPNNTSSCKVAEKLGMTIQGQITKRYNHKDMLHLIYVRKRSDNQ